MNSEVGMRNVGPPILDFRFRIYLVLDVVSNTVA